jgi:hypothetical protein
VKNGSLQMEVRRLVTALDALRSDIEDFEIKEKFAGLEPISSARSALPSDRVISADLTRRFDGVPNGIPARSRHGV